MSAQEVTEIIEAFGKIDLQSADVEDQMAAMGAMMNFAKALKPLVAKYSNTLPKKSTFLMKL